MPTSDDIIHLKHAAELGFSVEAKALLLAQKAKEDADHRLLQAIAAYNEKHTLLLWQLLNDNGLDACSFCHNVFHINQIVTVLDVGTPNHQKIRGCCKDCHKQLSTTDFPLVQCEQGTFQVLLQNVWTNIVGEIQTSREIPVFTAELGMKLDLPPRIRHYENLPYISGSKYIIEYEQSLD